MTLQTHYFIAVPLPDELKAQLSYYIKELQKNFSFTRWVHPEDVHITLAFLGAVNEADTKHLTDALETIAQNTEPFSLTLDDLGTFGNPQSPRVFWQGTKKSDQLSQLRDKVYAACEEIGFSLDMRRFHPHITLARKWNGAPFSEDYLLRANAKSDTFEVDEIVLYRSHLNKLPKYEKKEIFRLK